MPQPLDTLLQADNALTGRVQEAMRRGETGVRQLLASQKQELIERFEEMIDNHKKPIIEQPKPGMFGLTRQKAEELALFILTDGYNLALKDLKSKLQELEKEV